MTKPFLIDTHCHLHFPAYDQDRGEVLARMREKNILGITIGTAVNNSRAAVRLADATKGIWCTVGLHPSHATSEHVDENEGAVSEHEISKDHLIELARSSKKVVAIGETGLDFYRLDQTADVDAMKRKQGDAFGTHLYAALELDLPIVIHCRGALAELNEILGKTPAKCKIRGVVHSFTGTWEEAKPLFDLGLHLGINGIATFPLRRDQNPARSLEHVIKNMPLQKLLLETDAPYLAPVPYRGQRNEPIYVEEVAKHVAHVRGMSLEKVAEITTENAQKLFNLADFQGSVCGSLPKCQRTEHVQKRGFRKAGADAPPD